MTNIFKRFVNSVAVVIKISDYNDYENSYTKTELCSISGDLQPYSGGLAEKEYGLKTECQCRFYCALNSELAPGRYLKINNVYYKIMYVVNQSLGCTVLLKEEALNNG